MKDDSLATEFWNRVDNLWLDRSLKELAYAAGVDYVLLLNWRTKKRLPSLEHAYGFARALNTTIEYLVTGSSPDVPPDWLNPYINNLMEADETDLALVRRILSMKEMDNNNKQSYGT